MHAKIPSGKLRRSLIGGKTAAKVGGGVIRYLAKKPFMSHQAKQKARKELDDSSAKAIFLLVHAQGDGSQGCPVVESGNGPLSGRGA